MKFTQLLIIANLLLLASSRMNSLSDYWEEAKEKVKEFVTESKPYEKSEETYDKIKDFVDDKKDNIKSYKDKVVNKANDQMDDIDDFVDDRSDDIESNEKLTNSLEKLKNQGIKKTKEMLAKSLKNDLKTLGEDMEDLETPKYFGKNYTGLDKEDYQDIWDYIVDYKEKIDRKFKAFKSKVPSFRRRTPFKSNSEDNSNLDKDIVEEKDKSRLLEGEETVDGQVNDGRLLETEELIQIVAPKPID